MNESCHWKWSVRFVLKRKMRTLWLLELAWHLAQKCVLRSSEKKNGSSQVKCWLYMCAVRNENRQTCKQCRANGVRMKCIEFEPKVLKQRLLRMTACAKMFDVQTNRKWDIFNHFVDTQNIVRFLAFWLLVLRFNLLRVCVWCLKTKKQIHDEKEMHFFLSKTQRVDTKRLRWCRKECDSLIWVPNG